MGSPPLFFESYRTDEDYKNREVNIFTYKDNCFLCDTKLELDVEFQHDDNMCLWCKKLNPEY